jgi:hypothetical protein
MSDDDKLPAVIPPAPKKRKLPPPQLSVVAPDGQQLPAVARAPNPIKALKKFADRLDDLKGHFDWLQELRKKDIAKVRRYPLNPDEAQKVLDFAIIALRLYDEEWREKAKELDRDYDEIFNPTSAYDEDDEITEDQVSKHIGLLLGSYPNANPGNDDAYVRVMIGEVLAECPTVVVLESACSQIRRANKFPPTTAEVIEAINEQNGVWSPRLRAMWNCNDSAWLLRKELAEVTELVADARVKAEEWRLAAEEKKRADDEKKRLDDELRAQPLELGDRVQHHHMGRGSIVSKASYEDAGFTVLFDHGEKTWILSGDLARLIPGDDGFEITEAESEAAAKKAAAASQQRIEATMEAMEDLDRRPVVGDRVRNSKYGYGTVVWHQTDDIDDGVIVHFDGDDSVREMPVDRLGVCGAIEIPMDLFDLEELPEDDFGWRV